VSARNSAACANPKCDRTVAHPSRGRRRKFCSNGCRQQALRSRNLRYEIVGKGVIAESPNKPNFNSKLSSDTNGLKRCCVGNNSYQGESLRWIKVNDCIWKLTDGEKSLTSGSHGQWGGHYTEKAVAWVMEVGWPFEKSAWYYARHDDRSYGPTDFKTAKAAALAFVTGAPLPQDNNARTFIGPVDLNADPEATAELNRENEP
jgi:hypothetical protein